MGQQPAAGNGPFPWNSHMIQITPCWIANDTKGEDKQSDYIVQKANILTFTEVPLHCLPRRKVSFVPCDGFVQKRAHFATFSGMCACRLVNTLANNYWITTTQSYVFAASSVINPNFKTLETLGFEDKNNRWVWDLTYIFFCIFSRNRHRGISFIVPFFPQKSSLSLLSLLKEVKPSPDHKMIKLSWRCYFRYRPFLLVNLLWHRYHFAILIYITY